MSAKQEATRESRIQMLIDSSADHDFIPPFKWSLWVPGAEEGGENAREEEITLRASRLKKYHVETQNTQSGKLKYDGFDLRVSNRCTRDTTWWSSVNDFAMENADMKDPTSILPC